LGLSFGSGPELDQSVFAEPVRERRSRHPAVRPGQRDQPVQAAQGRAPVRDRPVRIGQPVRRAAELLVAGGQQRSLRLLTARASRARHDQEPAAKARTVTPAATRQAPQNRAGPTCSRSTIAARAVPITTLDSRTAATGAAAASRRPYS